MASKPETTFTHAVHRLLPDELYHLKLANPYIGGPPDVYYEGKGGILFVEYKYVPSFPPVLSLLRDNKLTRLQADWLGRAERNGVPCAVIVGCQSHGLVFQKEAQWSAPVGREQWLATRLTKKEIADWITRKVTMCPTSFKSSVSP